MFEIEKINQLIMRITAIMNYAKDIHYTVHGEAFFGKHLFADRIDGDNNEYIDLLKEVCVLGRGYQTLLSEDYLKGAIEFLPEVEEDDKKNFENIKGLIKETLVHIEQLDGLTRGDENLIGNVAQDLQQNLGLLNLQVDDIYDQID